MDQDWDAKYWNEHTGGIEFDIHTDELPSILDNVDLNIQARKSVKSDDWQVKQRNIRLLEWKKSRGKKRRDRYVNMAREEWHPNYGELVTGAEFGGPPGTYLEKEIEDENRRREFVTLPGWLSRNQWDSNEKEIKYFTKEETKTLEMNGQEFQGL